MSKKLSELKDTDMILVNNSCITKEDLLNDLSCYQDYREDIKGNIYTTTKYEAHIDAISMIESALEYESQEMYDGWYDDIMQDVTKEDIDDMQKILDRILMRSKNNNVSYMVDEEIEIDM